MKIQTPDPEHEVDLDTILSLLIEDERRGFDVGLYQTKWWDYRFMTPFEATMAFVDAFGVEARKIYARNIDYERAQHIRVITGSSLTAGLVENEIKAKRAFASFWRGRQVADALGMPYPEYTAEALTNRMRYWSSIAVKDNQGKWRTKMPTPNQLYAERDVEKIEARWSELKASKVYYANHHAFMVENYQGAQVQDQYCAYLMDRAVHSSNVVLSLRDMVESDKIPVEYLAQNADVGIYEQVMKPLLMV